MWLPEFACPECRASLDREARCLLCEGCGSRFENAGSLHQFLTPERVDAAKPFIRQYRLVRGREGHRAQSSAYYAALPAVPKDDGRAAEWKVRSASYRYLSTRALAPAPRRVLDLGAGNGWLSHRLSRDGHAVVALDQLGDETDGLGACRHYPIPFPTVLADFDRLPFGPGQFDAVVFNASLHYSPDPAKTLGGAIRMLRAGGLLIVMDSPMFVREADGEAMVRSQLQKMQVECGLAEVIRPGLGYLTFSSLRRFGRSARLTSRFVTSRGPLRWRVARSLARMRLGRGPAAFGVWVAR